MNLLIGFDISSPTVNIRVGAGALVLDAGGPRPFFSSLDTLIKRVDVNGSEPTRHRGADTKKYVGWEEEGTTFYVVQWVLYILY